MAQTNSNFATAGGVYPLGVSVSMIAAAIILSLVDLTFLNDVIGKLLDLGSVESMAIAFTLGLIGIAFMAHQGIKEAHGTQELHSTITHYVLWIGLGVSFVVIRLFSASIMQLDESLGDASLIDFFGLSIREVDLVLGPIMMILYLATGILAKDGFKNLLMNPEHKNWWNSWSKSRKEKKAKEEQLKADAARKLADQRDEAERKQKERELEIEENRRKQKEASEKSAIASALNGSYGNAMAQYRTKEKEIKEKYQKISANIDDIRAIDKLEDEFETKVKPGLLKIVQDSIHSVQNNTALAIRKKTGEDITRLRAAIEAHNKD